MRNRASRQYNFDTCLFVPSDSGLASYASGRCPEGMNFFLFRVWYGNAARQWREMYAGDQSITLE